MDYELILKEILGQGERQPLPQLFLMEMLVVNEKLMQLELAPDAAAIAKLREQLNGLEQQLCSRIQPVIDMYLAGNATVGDVVQLKEFYVSRKYLLRIIERLSTFASRDQVFKS
ncbi:iron-sulfur cluster co-chaperone HscB C-terminal domain-containing protein [Chitinophaga niabensis]|uniref:iron-sulfur cluster co-chaperone HscB C-terminal domain-containing protein n=1 Tax=Chitinophaga niabensis TaxID=536979 RepID=UPI0031BB7E7F